MEQAQLPIPDIEPAPISHEQFWQFTPEKFELVYGYLFDGPRDVLSHVGRVWGCSRCC
jgi:hypothetical protein